MNLKQLEYFVAIAEEHQITAAAKRLHISQPPLSYELAQLERELDTTLVIRGPRSCSLTDAGKLLYERAVQILALANATEREVSSVGKGMTGTLAVGVVPSSGGMAPTARARELCGHYPDVSIEVFEGATPEVIDLVDGGLVDVGVVRTPFKSQGLRCRYAANEPVVAIMAPEFEVGEEYSVGLEDLAGSPLVCDRRLVELVRDAFAEHDLGEPSVACLTADERTTCAWASAGMGVGLVPRSMLNIFDTGEQFIKLVEGSDLNTRLAVIWKADRTLSPLAERFIALLGDLG